MDKKWVLGCKMCKNLQIYGTKRWKWVKILQNQCKVATLCFKNVLSFFKAPGNLLSVSPDPNVEHHWCKAHWKPKKEQNILENDFDIVLISCQSSPKPMPLSSVRVNVKEHIKQWLNFMGSSLKWRQRAANTTKWRHWVAHAGCICIIWWSVWCHWSMQKFMVAAIDGTSFE